MFVHTTNNQWDIQESWDFRSFLRRRVRISHNFLPLKMWDVLLNIIQAYLQRTSAFIVLLVKNIMSGFASKSTLKVFKGIIELNAKEKQLFKLLLGVKSHQDQGKTENLTELRVAGGWVRDKVRACGSQAAQFKRFLQILKREGNDIDIALNNQSGVAFANSVNEYLKSIGHETRTIAVVKV